MDIYLKFHPRDYQLPLCAVFDKKVVKRFLAIWPRRAGKDVVAFNLMIREALRTIGVYYYIFPTYSQARKVIWDSITNENVTFLSFIPDELITNTNATEMKINLINGSIIQLIGSDNIDSIVGSNPRGLVFSEYALQDPRAYQYMRPILIANDGWSLFISTPRGKTHLYDMYQIAKQSPEWYCSKLTVEDTKHIRIDDIEHDITEGLISRDLAEQEYWTSFDLGVEGSYYSKYINDLHLKGQIGSLSYQPQYPVHTSWDLGVRDSTAIIFFQIVGQNINVIDFYENSKEGLEHYINVLIKQKPYIYGKHIAPHDIKVREFSSGQTRLQKARQLGIIFYPAPNLSIADGIEACRTVLPRMWFSEKSKALVTALENYRQEYDHKKKVYKPYPLHNQFSHACDAFRYLCISLPYIQTHSDPEVLDRRYREVWGDGTFPEFF